MNSSKKISLGQIDQIAIPDVEELQDKGFWVHPGNVTDANAILADGVHTVSWGGAANFPFGAGVILVKNDGSQRCDLAFGDAGNHKIAVRRWDSGTPGLWVVQASEDWVMAQNFIKSADLTGYATEAWVMAKNYATQAYVATKIADLVDSSPEALNTLNELAAALGDDPNFATTITNLIGQKADLNDPRFHSHANKAILDAITQQKINEWNSAGNKADNLFNSGYTIYLRNGTTNLSSMVLHVANITSLQSILNGKAEKKNIRVDNSPSVTLAQDDDVVIMTDSTVAIGTITIPSASDAKEKEYWLVQHWNYAVLTENYINSKGSTTNAVYQAVHLKSDGSKWYQTNNISRPNYVKVVEPGPVLSTGIIRYVGPSNGKLTFPSVEASKGQTIRIIFESPAILSDPYINTDGKVADHREEPIASGSVIELISDGNNWEKIN